MSRGFGWLQRRLLEELSDSDEPINIAHLAGAIFSLQPDDIGNFDPSRSQRVGIQRALQKLAEAGAVHRLSRHLWGSPAACARWEEDGRPGRERREALRSICADMKMRYGLQLSPADAEKLFDKYSGE